MLRPNYAMDAPPTSIEVGGFAYGVDWDFRTWIEVSRLMREFIPDASENVSHAIHNAEILQQIEQLVFGGVLSEECADEVLSGVCGFLEGYPEPPLNGSGGAGAPTYSFQWDLNAIVLAIRAQYGIDLSWKRTEPFHWWEFKLLFHNLCGDHAILRMMEIRGYKGKDAEMLKEKARYALPPDVTAAEQAILDEFNQLFYNA